MADLCCQYNIAGIKINDTTPGTNRLITGENGVTGLDGAPIRSEIDDEGQQNGSIVHPKFLGGRVIACHDPSLITAVVRMVRRTAKSTACLVCVDGLASYVTALTRVFRNPVRTGKAGRRS